MNKRIFAILFFAFLNSCSFKKEYKNEEQKVENHKEIYGKKLNDETQLILEKFCMDCHDEETQKGNVNLEPLFEKLHEGVIPLWQKSLEVIASGKMPPKPKKGKSKKRPIMSINDRKVVNLGLDNSIINYYENYRRVRGGLGTLRRVANYEYLQFLENIFAFPKEEVAELLISEENEVGFDNDSTFLQMSGNHFKIYEKIAEKVSEFVANRSYSPTTVLSLNLQKTPEELEAYGKKLLRKKKAAEKLIAYNEETRSRADRDSYFKVKHYQYIGPQYSRDGYPLLGGNNAYPESSQDRHQVDHAELAFQEESYHVPVSGVYEITVRARAHYAKEKTKYSKKPMKLHFGQRKHEVLFDDGIILADTVKNLKTLEVKNSEFYEYKFKTYLNSQSDIVFQVSHGPSGSEKRATKLKFLFRPHINASVELESLKIDGPYHNNRITTLFKELPKETQTSNLEEPKVTLSKEQFSLFFRDFASKVFRCSPEEVDVESYFKYLSSLDALKPFRSKLSKLLYVMLLSPEFLYFKESPNQLTNRQIASRMANFLWGSFPDKELFRAASSKELTSPKGRLEQAQRMFKETEHIEEEFLNTKKVLTIGEKNLKQRKRVDFFLEEFPYQWFDLGNVGDTTPSKLLYPEYNKQFEKDMITETLLFFKEVFERKASIFSFIESDWTMLNATLAKNYNIKNEVFEKEPEKFRRYVFRNSKVKSYRGGVLGQASYLAITSNGTTTRPVWRGAWIAKKFLGLDITPPPNVPNINVDTTKAKSLVQLMEVHRDNIGCRGCHQRFDGFGVALEKLDVIGKVRNRYWLDEKKTLGINTSSTGPNGKRMKSPVDVRKHLLKRKQEFTVNVMCKILEYALGRKMTYLDKKELEGIASSLLKKRNKSKGSLDFQKVLLATIQSDVFISK